MTAFVYSSSLVAAFLGGIVALFAPCCVVSLLPTFSAAALQRGRAHLLATTLEFAAGLALVLLPIVLGIGALGQLFLSYHGLAYLLVGLVLAAIAFSILSGRSWGLPLPALRVRGDPRRRGGVFVLGMVSGMTSACCAPVLAGVAAMSALAASSTGVLGLGLAYVFGMVFPLFLAVLLFGAGAEARARGLRGRVRLLGSSLLWTDFVAGAVFSVMAVLALYLAASGQATLTPGWLTDWQRWAGSVAGAAARSLQILPPVAQALLLVAVGLVLTFGLRARGASGAHRVAVRTSGSARMTDAGRDDPPQSGRQGV